MSPGANVENHVISGRFNAMGCLCEVLFDTDDQRLAEDLFFIAKEEALRIEKKFSRYLKDNILYRINNSGGTPVEVDEETARLLDFSDRAWRLSGGLFDITSGLLRKAWQFKEGAALPSAQQVAALLPKIGWHKVSWQRPVICLQPGMEIDLGGLGKEYAVDRVLSLLQKRFEGGVLVNFGGDIAAGGRRKNGLPWTIGIENHSRFNEAVKVVSLKSGALATSGDSKKFVLKNGCRYGHILNPQTGWPVSSAPHSVTAAADTCTEAGFFSTWGILNGASADQVLSDAGVVHWCQQ